jgi:hypothetical protein
MGYTFTFDLSKLSQTLFKEISEFSEKGKLTEKIGDMARNMVKKFEVDKITGLPVCDSITVIEDLINASIKNSIHKERFSKANKKVLFLPHCCRKYMDSRCKAHFDPDSASYLCRHCSEDCQVHRATILAKTKNYDVYVLPGGSCVKKIFRKKSYNGVIGVACTEEISLSTKILEQLNISVQNIPLIKNGCSMTQFNFETLQRMMTDKDKKTSG